VLDSLQGTEEGGEMRGAFLEGYQARFPGLAVG
jgi:hypothetical protein